MASDPTPFPYTYFLMWQQVCENYNDIVCTDKSFRALVSSHLLMAIFWEETQFLNIRQVGKTAPFTHDDWLKSPPPRPKGDPAPKPDPNDFGNHAVGFGQVERETINRALTLYPSALGPHQNIKLHDFDMAILGNDPRSVEMSWRILLGMWQTGQFRTREGLFIGYGGIKERPAAEQETFMTKIRGWIRCEIVQQAYATMPTVQLKFPVPSLCLLMAGAFWLARSDADFGRAFWGVSQDATQKVGARIRDLVFQPGQEKSNGYLTKPNYREALHDFVVDFDPLTFMKEWQPYLK
jgi:hypothetical protein